MKRKLITIALIISQILFVSGQSTTTNSTIEIPTLSPLTSSDLPASTSTSSPSFSPVPTTTNPSTNSTTSDPVIYPYNTVQISPNNGTWKICAQENTNYVSYSVKVLIDDPSPLTPNYGTTNDSQLDPNPTAPAIGVVARIIYSDGLRFIPSLSCYSEIITHCDQDAGTILMKDSDKYCLQIINPGKFPQKANVTVNFQSTVFKGGFTSDNKPGGNTKPLNGTQDSNASKNRESILGLFTILMSLWLVFDTL